MDFLTISDVARIKMEDARKRFDEDLKKIVLKIPNTIKEVRESNDINEIKKLEKLIDDICDIQKKLIRSMCVYFYSPLDIAGDDVIKYIRNIIRELETEFGDNYNLEKTKFVMNSDEIVNGYHLYDLKCDLLNRTDYIEYKKLYDDNSMTDEEFKEWFEYNACSDWNKQQPDGTCYGGHWNAPEGSEERDNAYELTREENLEELLKLPYSRKLLCETIKIGCRNRQESVRYSNFICEWVKRKSEKLN